MVFSSNIFLFVFLPVTLGIYYLLRGPFRNYFLLFASIFFYFWGEKKRAVIIIASIAINYVMGLAIHYAKTPKKKKAVLFAAVLMNLGLLFYFKYFNFFVNSINSIFNTKFILDTIALPIGISFFTFQGLTYVIDLYRGEVEVQKNPSKVALYISLFPQLIAGPIVRYKDISGQIENRKTAIDQFAGGIVRFACGLSKKVILANGCGIVADEIFNLSCLEHSAATAWLGVICYTLQIYYDFSGYSDMAIGLGRMFGFEFSENFNLPYVAASIREFWRRWHISLSSFFRDYVYIPLGGNRKGNVYVNNAIVFVLTGLWHGASWHFVVWGIWHGIFIILERLNAQYHVIKFKVPELLKHMYALLVIMLGWVIFRADSLGHAAGYLGRMFGLNHISAEYFRTGYYLDRYRIFIIAVSVLLAFGVHRMPLRKLKRLRNYVFIRNAAAVFLLGISIMYVMNATYNPFIYFRF